ncbi:putative selenoprotein O-like isoform X4 [Apostichopus japonicus]|uniref:Selenoprotein O n=1 Tax=Stichopus japonicus TaxID=307972 RepID=A0A2G8KPD6_STIJA|nr:putative selenoprotein O-like isoform X4 [Apostichopus japonicus]
MVTNTADMIAQWMSVGFAHGVMNTDNFSILSITIDYGPFGFLDGFDQSFVPNSSDDEGMYSIGNQATVGQYNLEKLRDALIPLLDSAGVRRSQEIIAEYSDKYHVKLMSLFREKLGLKEATETSDYLVALLLQVMEENRSDFTMTFRQLGELSLDQLANGDIAKRQWALVDLQDSGLFKEWVRLYVDQFSPMNDEVDLERRRRMNAVNPRYILRNWMAHQVIEEVEADDFEGLRRLHNILKNPFTEQEEAEALGYSARPPSWARKIRVSCSS